MKVRCIDDSDCSGDLKRGNIYTVGRIDIYYYLIETGLANGNGWMPSRFEKLQDNECPHCGEVHP